MKEKLYKQMLENLYEGVYFVDEKRTITFWNKGAERISGYKASEVLGKRCSDNILNHVDHGGCLLCHEGCPLQTAIDEGTMREAPVYLHHKDGHRVAVSIRAIPIMEDGKVIGAVEVFTDQADQFNRLKDLQELRTLVMKDPLTQLPNRRSLDQVLEANWRNHQNFGVSFGLIFMDIDHFKRVNDDYGHDIGDEVLKMVARSTRAALRRDDVVGRWGGEEFVIVLSNADADMIMAVSEKVRMLIESSFLTVNGEALSVTVSLGATSPQFQDDLPTMIKRADQLMYESKRKGRNQVSADLD